MLISPRARLLIVRTLCLLATSAGISSLQGEELARSPEQATPLAVGANAPDLTLPDANGRPVSLATGQPTVLIFYRGGWCPYCNAHLADVQKIEKDLVALGYRILAVSPETVEASKATAEKDHVSYTLLSDRDRQASLSYGVAYRVDDVTAEKYKNFGIKLAANPDGSFWMPVPSVFLLGKDGRIEFAHAEADYKKRLSSESLLAAARKAAGR